MMKSVKCVLAAIALSLMSAVASADEHPAQAMVVEAITQMLDVLNTEGERIASDPAFRQAKIDEIIVPHLDFETMTRLAVGKFWRRADSEQQASLVDEFKTLLLNTYTGALTEYSGEAIAFEPFRPESRDDRAVVRSTFSQSGGSDVPVLYKLRDKDGWSIYDIEVNNISLVTNYRTAFSNEIESGGIGGLIDTLKERNAGS